ncbi:unnamed protein product, partial [Ectocarpus sp. 6 AP-2014]
MSVTSLRRESSRLRTKRCSRRSPENKWFSMSPRPGESRRSPSQRQEREYTARLNRASARDETPEQCNTSSAMPGATVHATDFAPAMMDLIRKRAAEEGVSNVVASVADGEALTGFGDESVDAVTCTWGLLFMPNWQRAIQEFSRVLKGDGVVAVTLWERHEGSVFQRMRNVVETLVPGFQVLIDAEALGEEGGSAVVEEMKA